MRPTTLRPGELIRRLGCPYAYAFVRIERSPGRSPQVVLRSDACRGPGGTEDHGLCVATMGEVARHYQRVKP